MKKAISDHLSKTFFETSQKKKKGNNFFFFLALSFGFIAVFALGATFLSRPRISLVNTPGQVVRFQKHDGPYRLVFDFSADAPKTVSLNVDLPVFDLGKYKEMRFAARFDRADSSRPGAVKIGFFNKRRDGVYRYISDVGCGWKKFFVPMESFGNIDTWGQTSAQLVFMLEEWNISSTKGQLLVDEVEFLAS